MKLFRLVLISGLFFVMGSAWAARMIPPNMQVAKLKAASYPTVVLANDGWDWMKVLTLGWLDGSQTYQMTAGVRIRNQKNLFVVHGQLPRFAGEAVAVRFGNANQIEEIWILTPQERDQLRLRAERIKALQKMNQ